MSDDDRIDNMAANMTLHDNIHLIHAKIEGIWVLCIPISFSIFHPTCQTGSPYPFLDLISTTLNHQRNSNRDRSRGRTWLPYFPKKPQVGRTSLEIGIYWAHWLGFRSIADDDCFHHYGLSIYRPEEKRESLEVAKTSITVKPLGRLFILCG